MQSLKVNLKVAFRRESIAANVATERSFARMRTYVYLNGRVAAEHFAAQVASMLVGWRQHAIARAVSISVVAVEAVA